MQINNNEIFLFLNYFDYICIPLAGSRQPENPGASTEASTSEPPDLGAFRGAREAPQQPLSKSQQNDNRPFLVHCTVICCSNEVT